MHADITNLIAEIHEHGFYTWLKAREKNYEGSCPCFEVVIPELDLLLDCSCWRVGHFKYSGLQVCTQTSKYREKDLLELARVVLWYVTQVWSNTDFEYQVNEGQILEYTPKT